MGLAWKILAEHPKKAGCRGPSGADPAGELGAAGQGLGVGEEGSRGTSTPAPVLRAPASHLCCRGDAKGVPTRTGARGRCSTGGAWGGGRDPGVQMWTGEEGRHRQAAHLPRAIGTRLLFLLFSGIAAFLSPTPFFISKGGKAVSGPLVGDGAPQPPIPPPEPPIW